MKHPRLLIEAVAVALILPSPLFALQTGDTPQGLAAADFNGNGRAGLAVVHAFDDTLVILHQDGEGAFHPAQTLQVGIPHSSPVNAPRHVEAVDFDHDGFPDLLVLSSGNYLFGHPPSLQTFLNRGDGIFAAAEPLPLAGTPPGSDLFPVHFTLGDFGGPVGRDAAVALLRGGAVRILHGNGAGGFEPVEDLPVSIAGGGPEYLLPVWLPGGEAVSILAAAGGGVALLRQDSPGDFVPAGEIPLPETVSSRSLAWADFDGDGHGDLAIADEGGAVLVLHRFSATAPHYTHHSTLGDPSLAAPVDLALVGSAQGFLPSLAVANLHGGSLTVLDPEGPTVSHPAGLQPRRLVAADISGNGFLDVISANQGDQTDPENEDVSFVLRGGAGPGGVPVAGEMVQSLGPALGPRLARARAISSPQPSRVWVLEADGRALQELNPSPAFNANPNARFLQRITLPYEAGGFVFTQSNTYWVLERFGGRLHRYTTAQGFQETVELDLPVGGAGLRGLARIGPSGDFLLADPLASRIHRVTPQGAPVASVTAPFGPHDLAWDAATNRLYASHPGTNRVLAYTGDLLPDEDRHFRPGGGEGAFFGTTGMRGIAARPNQPGFDLLSREGVLFRSGGGSVVPGNALTIAPAVDIRAVAVDAAGGNVYLLGADFHVARATLDGLLDGMLFSLLPILELDPGFHPGGMAWDDAAQELLVADSRRPLVARLDGGGTLLGLLDDSGALGDIALTGAIAVDAAAGGIVYRSPFAAHVVPQPGTGKGMATWHPLPATADHRFFSMAGGYFISEGLDRSHLLFTPAQPEAGERFLAEWPPNGPIRAVHGGDEGTILLFEEGGDGSELQTLQVQFPESSRVVDWHLPSGSSVLPMD